LEKHEHLIHVIHEWGDYPKPVIVGERKI